MKLRNLILTLVFFICLPVNQPALSASFQVLGNLAGRNPLSWAYGVSGDGSTVVGASYSSSGLEAFRWTQETGMVGLGDLPGGSFNSVATQASFDGSVVLGYGHTISSVPPAFRWTQPGGMVEVNDAPGDNAVLLRNGMVVTGAGFYAKDASANGSTLVGFNGKNAVRWTQNTGIVNLSQLPSVTSSQAAAVSADGIMIVGYFNAGVHEAFRWTETGGMIGLGDLPGGAYQSAAFGVSGDGSVIVGESAGSSLPDEAFIWDGVHGMRSLQTVLEELGVDLGGWTLGAAWDVSDDGRTIVGTAINLTLNRQEAFIAVIPEPQSSILLITGTGLLARRLRRLRE